MFKAICAMKPREVSEAKALEVVAELEVPRPRKIAEASRNGRAEAPICACFLCEYWWRILINNSIEELNREIRRGTRVVDTFPDERFAFMLATARLEHATDLR